MKKIFFMMLSTLLLLGITPAAGVAQTTSIPYIGSDPELTLSSPWTACTFGRTGATRTALWSFVLCQPQRENKSLR